MAKRDRRRKVTSRDIQRMKSLREGGLAYHKIANELGLSRATVSNYLKGKSELKKIENNLETKPQPKNLRDYMDEIRKRIMLNEREAILLMTASLFGIVFSVIQVFKVEQHIWLLALMLLLILGFGMPFVGYIRRVYHELELCDSLISYFNSWIHLSFILAVYTIIALVLFRVPGTIADYVGLVIIFGCLMLVLTLILRERATRLCELFGCPPVSFWGIFTTGYFAALTTVLLFTSVVFFYLGGVIWYYLSRVDLAITSVSAGLVPIISLIVISRLGEKERKK